LSLKGIEIIFLRTYYINDVCKWSKLNRLMTNTSFCFTALYLFDCMMFKLQK